MDTSFTVKPRDAVSRTARTSAVRTEVAPAQSVTPPAPEDQSHYPTSAPDTLVRDLVDPEGRDVLHREREKREWQRKRRRRPDDALMRQRAYGRAADASEPHPPHDGDDEAHADIQI